MLTWISRVMAFVFLFSVLTPDLLYAQRAGGGRTPNRPSQGRPSSTQSSPASNRSILQQHVENRVAGISQDPFLSATSAEDVEKIYGARLWALLDKYDEVDARTNYALLSKTVGEMHDLTEQYEKQQKFYQKLSAPPGPAVAESTYYRGGGGKKALNELLAEVDRADADSMDLVEWIDPLASTQDGNARAMQVIYASEIFLQALDSATSQEVSDLRDFLARLHVRASYRVKRSEKETRNSDVDIMQRSMLRMLLHKVNDSCVAANGGCPRTGGYFSSFQKDVEDYKDFPDDLNLVVQYAARYAVFNLRAPEKLSGIVDQLEKKPGRRPTHFETKYSSALGTLMYALVDAVAQVPQDEVTLDKAKKFLIDMAGASHATDTRVFAIGAAARLHKMSMSKNLSPFTEAQRQKLVGLAVDIYHPLSEGGINGARETYGLKASAMKNLADSLVASMRCLLPVTGRETLTKDAHGNFALLPGKSVQITYITSNNRIMFSNGEQREVPTYLLGTDNVPYPVLVSNQINFAQQNKENTLEFWSEAFMFIALGQVLKVGLTAFKLVGRALKTAPRALKAARIASKGKKLQRFTTKMRQGLKYGATGVSEAGNAAGRAAGNGTRPGGRAAGETPRPTNRPSRNPASGGNNVNSPSQGSPASHPQAGNAPRTEPVSNLPKAKGSDGGIELTDGRMTPDPVEQGRTVTGTLDAQVDAAAGNTPVAPAPSGGKSFGQRVKDWLTDYRTAMRRSNALQSGIPGIPAPRTMEAARAARLMEEAARAEELLSGTARYTAELREASSVLSRSSASAWEGLGRVEGAIGNFKNTLNGIYFDNVTSAHELHLAFLRSEEVANLQAQVRKARDLLKRIDNIDNFIREEATLLERAQQASTPMKAGEVASIGEQATGNLDRMETLIKELEQMEKDLVQAHQNVEKRIWETEATWARSFNPENVRGTFGNGSITRPRFPEPYEGLLDRLGKSLRDSQNAVAYQLHEAGNALQTGRNTTQVLGGWKGFPN